MLMKKILFPFVFLLALPLFVCGAEGIIFEDPLSKKLEDGWSWLREVPTDWRITDEALEIKMEPLPQDGARNIFFRKPPKKSEGPFVVTVEVKAVQPYTNQYQQTGLYWMQGDQHKFKFVMERIDGELFVFPGKKPIETAHVVLRLRIDDRKIIAEYQPNAKGEFLQAFEAELPERNDETDRIAFQCWHGPPAAESWTQFRKFSITKPGSEPEKNARQ